MKLISKLVLIIIALCVLGAQAQSPTPIPLATPAPGYTVYPPIVLTAEQWQTAITTLPATPQNLLTLAGALVKLPTTGTFQGLNVMRMKNGSVKLTLIYGP